MEENTTTTVAAEAAIESIKKLMAAIGNDDELKQKLEDTLSALSGKVSAPQSKTNEGQEPEPESEPAADAANAASAENNDAGKETADSVSTRTTVSSDAITEDAIAGMVVGFVAGAALVGGGVILHKILSD